MIFSDITLISNKIFAGFYYYFVVFCYIVQDFSNLFLDTSRIVVNKGYLMPLVTAFTFHIVVKDIANSLPCFESDIEEYQFCTKLEFT